MLYHNFDPVILQLGPVAIKWYGVSYIIGFFLAWLIGRKRVSSLDSWNTEVVTDLIFFCAWGVILGGRLGYWIFYGLDRILVDPFEIFKIWHGGMSFHGGLIGVFIALYFLAKKYQKSFAEVCDFTAMITPVALFCGRIGNFINGGLYGRATDVPWAVIFPYSDGQPRHPSQLYEALLEGLILAIIMWYYTKKPKKPWNGSAVFLIGYGVGRFVVEFYRQPDSHMGFVLFDWMTQGQLLTIPMILIGLSIMIINKFNKKVS